MKAKFTINAPVQEFELEDYGHEGDIRWEDLDEYQQDEIADSLRQQFIEGCGFSVEIIK